MVQHLNLTKTTFSEDDYIKIEVESVIFIDKIEITVGEQYKEAFKIVVDKWLK